MLIYSCAFVCMYAVRVGLRGMSDPHSNWSDTGAGVGVGPVVSDGLAGGGSSTPVVLPPVGGAFPYNNTVHQNVNLCSQRLCERPVSALRRLLSLS